MLALIGAALAGPTVLGWELDTQLTDEACKQSTLVYLRDQYDQAEQTASAQWDTLTPAQQEQWRAALADRRTRYDTFRAQEAPSRIGDFDLCGPPDPSSQLAEQASWFGVARDHMGFIRAVFVQSSAGSALEIDRWADQVRADLSATHGAPRTVTLESTTWSTPGLDVELGTVAENGQAHLFVMWVSTQDVHSAGYRASVWGDTPMGWSARQVQSAAACWAPPADEGLACGAEHAALLQEYESKRGILSDAAKADYETRLAGLMSDMYPIGRLSPESFQTLHAEHHALGAVDVETLSASKRAAHDARVTQTRRALQAQAACTPAIFHPDLVQYWASLHDDQVRLHGRTELGDADSSRRLVDELTQAYGLPDGTGHGLYAWDSPVGSVWLDTRGEVAELTIRYD